MRLPGELAPFSLLLLISYVSALPTWPHSGDNDGPAKNLPPRPVQKRQYGNASASIAASMLSPSTLYWHVSALVNGRAMAVMVDTGSSDL